MNKFIKKIINGILTGLFLFIKDKKKKAFIITFISKILFNKNNSLQYDPEFNGFWLKNGGEYLFIVDKPIYNFSKKNLYKYIFNIYCKVYKPKKGDVIVDIGAGIGTETLFFHEMVGNEGKIYSIEAAPSSYNKLVGMCIKNRIENGFNFNIAIANFNGNIWIEETENFEVNQINTIQKGIEIKAFTLDQFIIDKNIQKIDLLKVNIEGAELEMLDGMTKAIQIINNIAISCHDFLFIEDKQIKTKVVQFLKRNNFEITFNHTDNKITNSWIYGKRI